MAALTFADSHNMVAYLEKSEDSDDFAEIVDFLNASPIRYALTVSLTVYVSYIEQFWSTAKIKTVNNETQIRTKVDGKTIVITKSSMRRDLHFDDEDGITCLTNTEIFENLQLMGEPTNLDADKAVHKERGDSVERATTPATSLDADLGGSPRCQEAMGDTIAQTRSERVSTPSYDSPLLGVNTPRSDEERIKLKELMDMCTKLSDRVLDLENVKDAQDLEIKKLKKRVKKLEKKRKSRTPQLKRRLFKVRIESFAEKSLGDQEDASKQGVNEINQEEGILWFQEDLETQGRYGHDTEINTASTSITTASINITTVEPVIIVNAPVTTAGVSVSTAEPKWDFIEARIDADAQLAERLQAEEREHMSVEERARLLMEFIAARKKFFAAKRAEEQRNKPPTKAEQRKKMCIYMKHMARYKDKNFKGKSFDKEVSKKRAGERPIKESAKRQKIEDDAEKVELKACLEIVPSNDSAVNIESLATKYLIVDWKTHILVEDKMYYQIIRADGSTKYYKIFSAMLNDFDRQDVLDLYWLVKERFESTSLEGYDRLLWGDLITLFEPSEEDEIRKAQQDYTLISWRLYDSCGIHLLLMDTGITIHMLVEKKYPLTQEMLSKMLSRRLEVDHECEMAFELLRFIKSQYKK
ncbi:hypothetical protein Tco_0026518 [Tanacetum coccineum]